MSRIAVTTSFLVDYHIPHTNNRLLLVFFVQVEVKMYSLGKNKKKSDVWANQLPSKAN